MTKYLARYDQALVDHRLKVLTASSFQYIISLGRQRQRVVSPYYRLKARITVEAKSV